MPASDEIDEEWEGNVRSLTLDAPELRMIAKIDLVEGGDGSVSPIDHKKGRPRADGDPWDPERLQVAAQVLILRENGYRCDRGYLSFRETRTRVAIEVDSKLERHLRKKLSELRALAASDRPPPPLLDSPKCPRCSLVSICLPDETNVLREKRRDRVRRLIARRPDAGPLYVQEPGAHVHLAKGRIEVRKEGELLASLRQIDVSEVALYGGAGISGPALRTLAREGIPITHFSHGGHFDALTVGVEPGNIGLRIAQFRWADDAEASLQLARRFVSGKIRNARVLLRRNARDETSESVRELQRLARLAGRAPTAEQLLGIEGAAGREYYRALSLALRPRERSFELSFDFERRSRRPPRDRVNAVLSFLYAMLVREATLAVRVVGFDPFLGFYHRPRFGKPALALDLMEEFRPLLADSVLLTLVNGLRLTPGDFAASAGRYSLIPSGRRAVISAFEQRLTTEVIHPLFRYRITYRRALELQARLLAATVLGEIPEYRPFVTR
jgi:CRISPR-associated protein Cas1